MGMLRKLKSQIKLVEATSWKTVRLILKDWLWIDAIHDKHGKALVENAIKLKV